MEKNSGEVLTQRTGLRIMSSTDRIRQLIRHEMFRANEETTHESFADADDFELEDGEEWVSPYEETFEPESPPDPVKDSPPSDVGSVDVGAVSASVAPGASASAHVVDGDASRGP